MKSLQPPSLAIWLLEHLMPGGNDDALAGDLLEAYSQGRSAGWYWRQVLVAIMVGFSKELRMRWITIIFAVTVCGAVPWQQLWYSSRFQSIIVWGIKLPWPASLLYAIAFLVAFQAVILLVALSIYIGATKSVSLRNFLKGLSMALLILSLGTIGVMFLSVLQLPRLFFYYVVWRLPLFFSLLLGMWVARPSARRTEATRISA
jgi:hypothetical protein